MRLVNWTPVGAAVLVAWLLIGVLANSVMEMDSLWENDSHRWTVAYGVVPPLIGFGAAIVVSTFLGLSWVLGQIARLVAVLL